MSTNKKQLANLGVNIATMFCEKNNIRMPTLHILDDENDPEYQKIKRFATCGYYRRNHVYVGVGLCAHQNPNYSWAGFISDRTPYGVIQHELGHHVDEVKTGVDIYRNRGAMLFSTEIRKRSGEKRITSYCPNDMEWFAEIFRLFVTNPDLLSKIRPKTYAALIDSGLKPVVTLDARTMLMVTSAPPRVFERMNDWITNRK